MPPHLAQPRYVTLEPTLDSGLIYLLLCCNYHYQLQLEDSAQAGFEPWTLELLRAGSNHSAILLWSQPVLFAVNFVYNIVFVVDSHMIETMPCKMKKIKEIN